MEKKERTINLGVALPKTCHVKGRHRLTTLLSRNNTFQLFSGAQQRGFCFNFFTVSAYHCYHWPRPTTIAEYFPRLGSFTYQQCVVLMVWVMTRSNAVVLCMQLGILKRKIQQRQTTAEQRYEYEFVHCDHMALSLSSVCCASFIIVQLLCKTLCLTNVFLSG